MADIEEEIIAVNKKMVELFNNGSVEEHCEVYDNDIRMMPPGGKVFLGKEAVKELVRNANLNDLGETFFTVDQVIPIVDDVVCVLGHGHSKKNDGTITSRVKVVNVWKKIDGEWKLHVNFGHGLPI